MLFPTLRLRDLGPLNAIWGPRQGRLANCPPKGKEGAAVPFVRMEIKGRRPFPFERKERGTRFNSFERDGKGHHSFLSRTKEKVAFCPLK